MTKSENGSLDTCDYLSKQGLLKRLLNTGVTPETAETYYEILRQFFAGKLAKYRLEERLKSLLSSQAIQVHNETLLQVLQRAQQGGSTQVPSLTTHEKESKYVKRRLLVKRPIKSITSWNEEQQSYYSTEKTAPPTFKRKRSNSRNKAEKDISSQAKKESLQVSSDKNTKSSPIGTKSSSMDRTGDSVGWNSQGLQEKTNLQSTRQASPTLPSNWKDVLQEQRVHRIGKRMKQIAAENEIYEIEKDAMVDLFRALEFHLLDIIKGAREQMYYEQKKSHNYRPTTLSIRDLYRFTEYAQNILGDPYCIDRTSLAFTIF